MSTTRPDFTPLPALWPEQYTDAYSMDRNYDVDDLEHMLIEIVEDTAGSHFEYVAKDGHVFTSDQVIVEMLTERLYGREIAHIHVHYPSSHE